MRNLWGLFFIIIFFISGCAKPKPIDIKTAAEIVKTPKSFNNLSSLESVQGTEKPALSNSLENINFIFNDPYLKKLFEKAEANNPDVLILVSKIRQARSEAKITGSEILPSVSAALDYTGGGNLSKSRSVNHNLNLNASFSWEADLFGKLTSQKKAAEERFYSAELNLEASKVSLFSDVASYYFNIRSASRKIRINRAIAESYKELMDIYKARWEIGLSPASDYLSAQNDYYRSYNTIKDLENETEKNKNALFILIGDTDLGFDIEEDYSMPFPKLPEFETIPSSALFNRADILSLVNILNANIYETAGRKAARYPSLILKGNIGQVIASSSGLGDILWQIAGSIAAPLFSRTNLNENLKIQKEAEKQAEYTLKKAVSAALGEIENSAFQAMSYRDIYSNIKNLYENTAETFRYVREKYNSGLTDIVEFSKSKIETYNARISFAQAELNNITASLNLYKAFGGSFGKPLEMVKNGNDY